MLCGQRVRPPWLLLLLTLVCNSSFPKKKKKMNLRTASCGPPLGLPVSPAFFGGPASGGRRGKSRPGQGFVLRTTKGRPAPLRGGGAGTGCPGGMAMSQHGPACLWRLSHAQERPPPLGMPPCSPAQRLGNLHFALARWRPSRGLLRLECAQS